MSTGFSYLLTVKNMNKKAKRVIKDFYLARRKENSKFNKETQSDFLYYENKAYNLISEKETEVIESEIKIYKLILDLKKCDCEVKVRNMLSFSSGYTSKYKEYIPLEEIKKRYLRELEDYYKYYKIDSKKLEKNRKDINKMLKQNKVKEENKANEIILELQYENLDLKKQIEELKYSEQKLKEKEFIKSFTNKAIDLVSQANRRDNYLEKVIEERASEVEDLVIYMLTKKQEEREKESKHNKLEVPSYMDNSSIEDKILYLHRRSIKVLSYYIYNLIENNFTLQDIERILKEELED